MSYADTGLDHTLLWQASPVRLTAAQDKSYVSGTRISYQRGRLVGSVINGEGRSPLYIDLYDCVGVYVCVNHPPLNNTGDRYYGEEFWTCSTNTAESGPRRSPFMTCHL